jgi:trans-2,3-dihydro-3-hydroxyanthranilate isomerase
MEKNVKIFQIDSFTDKPFLGNPAGVCFTDELDEFDMQKIANEMNLAETAFLSKSNEADYNLRWFTPTNEVDLCGHATIASLHFLKENNLLIDGQEIKFSTLSGILKCGIRDKQYFMEIPIYSMEKFDDCKEEIIEALQIERTEINDAVPFVRLENTNIYIYIETLDQLKAVQPDFNKLIKITEKNKDVEGFVLFTLETFEEQNSAHIRYFVPYHGIDEDVVTGSANGPLILVLEHLGFIKNIGDEINVTFEQGDFKGRPGRVNVNYLKSKNELYISGNAVTVLKGELFF